MSYFCNTCKSTYDEKDFLPWICECGGYLYHDHMPKFTKDDIKTNLFNMWRYDFAYPLKYEDLKVTYKEGLTPLVDGKFAKCNLQLKMDSLMPTGSFKDRGTVMVINYLLQHGVSKITEDSSGNGGSSAAGYCALAGIPCDIYVPEGRLTEKLNQIKSYGANVHEIKGTREDVAAAAQVHSTSYAGHNWHPMFVQGTKSLAYEIWEQNNFDAPKNILTVAGNGSIALGIYEGFKELMFNDLITEMPRLFVVQAENCNPIYRMYSNSSDTSSFRTTIAEGISLAAPNKGHMVVDAVRATKGQVLSVKEEEIIVALKELAANGFFVEPTSAAAYAGLNNLIEDNIITKEDHVVMIVTGSGLKTSATIAGLYEDME